MNDSYDIPFNAEYKCFQDNLESLLKVPLQ